MKNIFWIVLIISLIGCNQNKGLKPQATTTEKDTTVFNEKLNITPQKVQLLPEAGKITSGWLAYIIAQNEIENFKDYTINDVVSNAPPIAEIFKNLKETLPDSLKANPVEARLSVLLTDAKILEQLSQQQELQAKKIGLTAEDLVEEFNNLKIQINELFLKTLEEFELELDKYEAPKDSIELADDRDSNKRDSL